MAIGYELLGSLRSLILGFFNLPLDAAGLEGQIASFRLVQKPIKSATMLYRSQRIRANPETNGTAKDFAHQADIAQIGQKTPARPVMRMTDIVAGHDPFACKFATPRHKIAPVNVHLRQMGWRRDDIRTSRATVKRAALANMQ